MSAKDEVVRFHLLEQDGLKRAEGRDAKPKGDAPWFRDVQTAVNEEMRPFFRKMGEDEWANFASMLANTAYYGSEDATSCQYSGENRINCPASESTYRHLEGLDNEYKDLPDRPPPPTKRCTHLVAAKNLHEYKLNHTLNDVTACFHRSIEHYEEMARKWHKEGKCMWRE